MLNSCNHKPPTTNDPTEIIIELARQLPTKIKSMPKINLLAITRYAFAGDRI
jgi:hypothetical protein